MWPSTSDARRRDHIPSDCPIFDPFARLASSPLCIAYPFPATISLEADEVDITYSGSLQRKCRRREDNFQIPGELKNAEEKNNC
jgi:hypothetical protein